MASISPPSTPTAGPSSSKGPAIQELHSLLNQILRITTSDSRVFIGTFAGTDKPLNIILINAEEYRMDAPGQENSDGRFVGQIMLPWNVVLKVEAHVKDHPPTRKLRDDSIYLCCLLNSMALYGIQDQELLEFLRFAPDFVAPKIPGIPE